MKLPIIINQVSLLEERSMNDADEEMVTGIKVNQLLNQPKQIKHKQFQTPEIRPLIKVQVIELHPE
jgi:hypothetical protein